ncbi:LpqB family beta-propeller domain-containing protein [Saccharopolyspora rectivirgula]|jgi:hypothetical protein|uniref:Sporulation protein n=1 Tax=Saccharopolyspora rectivirgula TaxID=28042 RepID=A0A073B6F2_9PSEU|nr:LpqB family beta-propeller domain-containing protein [Saccharopolyspora rectivirgula]KEI43224.1 sporulation protein [Saccharopolyspora rectivirgula]
MTTGSLRRLLALAACLLVLTGCASIPEHSSPKAIKRVDGGNASVEISPPPEGLDPFALVRSFVDSAASPEKDHEAARLHLAGKAERDWHPPAGLLLLTNVDTIPTPQTGPQPRGVQSVTLQADKVGRLLPDSSFVPETGEYTVELRTERQPNGEWRIVSPPPELIASRSSFESIYRPVPVYFLNHSRTAVVPDIRYLPAQPTSTLPRQVIDLLIAGPSKGMTGAMQTALPEGVGTTTNTSESPDAALEVNFTNLGDISLETRRLIAAQVVLSLQSVSSARVRLMEEGSALLPEKKDLRPSDVQQYSTDFWPRPDLPGLAVVDERLVYLDSNANPVPGAAGSGELDIVRAGQSPDGKWLAAVTRRPEGVALRIGAFGENLPELPVTGSFMSKPTWRGSSEVWTVVDGRNIVRAVRTADGWQLGRVDGRQLAGDQPVAELRVSRDGTRVAAVVGGDVVVAGVVEDGDQVTLQRPVVLQPPGAQQVTRLEWRQADFLVALTDSNSRFVYDVTVDGYQWNAYTASNLGQPLNAVTVAPDGRVIVADRSGLWQATDTDDVWSLLSVPIGGGSLPFYPG